MALFLSTFVNKVDKKGRVSVPASFRAALSAAPYQGVVAYPSFTAPAIEGCGMDVMERLAESAEQFAAFSPEQEQINALIFAESRQLPWDPEGRIMLPEEFMGHAGIADACAFVGKGKTFQIWQPEAFRASLEEMRERARRERPTLALRRGEEPK